MKISIFGMGYVGVVSAGCLAGDGHEIIGVDPVQTKVDLLNEGKAPIIEKDIGDLIQNGIVSSQLRTTTSAVEAIENSVVSFVCVGTPSQLNGNLDLTYIRRVCKHIGEVIRVKSERHLVVIRSTILPGTRIR